MIVTGYSLINNSGGSLVGVTCDYFDFEGRFGFRENGLD